jgi:hypothetical protein
MHFLTCEQMLHAPTRRASEPRAGPRKCGWTPLLGFCKISPGSIQHSARPRGYCTNQWRFSATCPAIPPNPLEGFLRSTYVAATLSAGKVEWSVAPGHDQYTW